MGAEVADGISPGQSEGPRIRSIDIQGQEKTDVPAQAEQIHPSSALSYAVSLGPQHTRCPPAMGRVSFIPSTYSNANLSDTPRNKILPAIWASLCSVKLAHGVNHHKHPLRQI